MKDFSYIGKLINNKLEETPSNCPRDPIFKTVLDLFSKAPVKIFQIGAIETFESKFRWGSGWSDIIFGEYISKHGGELTVVDINLDHLANSYFLSQARGYEVKIGLGDGLQLISPGFDIYYLDGADEPTGNQETFDQFKKIEDSKCVVIVDDVKTKGQLVMPYAEKKGYQTRYYSTANGVLTIDMRNK